jgi:hypothetical protein
LVAPEHTYQRLLKAPSVLVRFNQILFFSILLAVADFAFVADAGFKIIGDHSSFIQLMLLSRSLSVTAPTTKGLTAVFSGALSS